MKRNGAKGMRKLLLALRIKYSGPGITHLLVMRGWIEMY